MKPREFQELKGKPIAELQKFHEEQRERLRSLQFDLAAGKVKNVKEIRALRKNIAQTNTLITEKGMQNREKR